MAKKTSNLKRFLSLQAENDLDRDEWMSVLLNSKDAALNQEFQNNGQTNNVNACFLELQRTIVSYIRTLPGNERCCDCDSTNGTLRSLARDSPWNTHHKGSITLRLVSSLTWSIWPKHPKVLLFRCTETTASIKSNRRLAIQWYFPTVSVIWIGGPFREHCNNGKISTRRYSKNIFSKRPCVTKICPHCLCVNKPWEKHTDRERWSDGLQRGANKQKFFVVLSNKVWFRCNSNQFCNIPLSLSLSLSLTQEGKSN